MHIAVARRADTKRTKISVAEVSRVIAALCDLIAENPDFMLHLAAAITRAKNRRDQLQAAAKKAPPPSL